MSVKVTPDWFYSPTTTDSKTVTNNCYGWDDRGLFAPQGWVCPLCGRVYSPMTPWCYFCGNQETKTTTTTTTPSSDTAEIKANDFTDPAFISGLCVGGSRKQYLSTHISTSTYPPIKKHKKLYKKKYTGE